MSAYGTRDIRSWEWTVLDQLALQEIRETGYLGNLWGADFYVSDQVAYGTMYIMTSPKFLAWMPFRRDTQVIPAILITASIRNGSRKPNELQGNPYIG